MTKTTQGRVFANAALVPGKDDDLINWLLSIQSGDRADAIKRTLRSALFGVQPDQAVTHAPDLMNEMLRSHEERIVGWVKDWIEHFNREIEQVKSIGFLPAVEAHVEAAEQMDEQEAARLKANLKKAKW